MRFASLLVVAAIWIGLAIWLLHGTADPSTALAEPKPPAAECRWADTPIVLDGADDDPAWKHAQVIDGFGQPWLADKAPALRGKTRAKLLWDRDYLYFFADMDDPDLFANVTEHDGAIWETDCFELFFRPGPDKPGYFEFEVNAANAVFDAFFPKCDVPKIIEHIKNGEFRVETKVKLRGTLNQRDDVDQGWSVEGRIPWADFLRAGGRPEPGEQWRFTLTRCNYDKGQPDEPTATAPIKEKKLSAWFHQIEDYAPLTFVGPTATTTRPHGIAKREPVVGSTVVGSPDPPPPFRVKRLYPSYAPKYPILAKAVPGTDQLLVIAENHPWGATVLSRLKDDPASKTSDAVDLLKTPDGGTAYDFCFHPKFAENRYLYVGWNGKFTGGKLKKKACRITRYTMKPGPPLTIDEKSATTILEWESDGHNGAAICFGTDGMMYVTSGDGTSDSDTDEMGQRTDNLLSKVLRIDVDRPSDGKPYSVPKDNPFVGDKRFAPETWAYGLRNPWRIDCDPKTGHIWVGNNGQDLWEQAYLVRKGDNYGWSVTEGSHPFYPHRKAGPTPIVKPTIEHHHSEFRSLTGGIVFRGKQLPELDGAYLYADYSTGRIWGMKHDGTNPIWHKEVATPRLQITGFGLNTRGELLIVDHSPVGGLYTLEPMPKQLGPSTFPRKLSESGLFESVKEHRMKSGVIPYSVNAPFWSDGMHKERWLVLPGTETIAYTRTRGWNFPDRTVLVKSFALEREEGKPASRQWVETRFLTKQDGEWYGYTYRWNDAGTDAELLPAGGLDQTFTVKTPTGVREQVWHYPSRAECMVCHSRAANFVLGLSSLQMNKSHEYAGCTDNQLRVFEHLGVLKGLDWSDQARTELADRAAAKGLKGKDADAYAKLHGLQPGQRAVRETTLLPTTPDKLPRLVDPYDPKEDLTKRAKSWLHTNCANCHVEAGGGNAQMELEFNTALDKMRILDVKPIHTPLGLPDARLVAPGSPERSVLLKRAKLRGKDQMPPLSTNRPDEAGVALLREWISSLKK
jgi:glucose/arabinose dehydrogenase